MTPVKRIKLKTKNSLVGLMFVSPWIIGFLIFSAFPFFYSLFLSFQEVKITTEGIITEYVKLANYRYAFSVDAVFVEDLVSYIWRLLISVPIITVFSLIIALLLNRKVKFRGFFRTIFFLPVIISSGPVIQELIDQGATTIPALQAFEEFLRRSGDGVFISLFLFLTTNLIVLLWFSGVQILIFLAALQKLNRSVYEAAMVDGASGWETFWKITLPSLTPMIFVNVIYTIVNLSVFSLNPVINHIQVNMFKVETGFGYASSLSWIYFIVIALILLIVVGIMILLGRRTSVNS